MMEWNDMRYYVAKDKLFIDRFRDCMQKKFDENLKNWLSYGHLKKYPHSAQKNCRHTKIHAIRPKLNIFSSSFLQTSPFYLYY